MSDNTQKLTPSLEDYLEVILQLERKHRVARVRDIAHFLSVKMPSVTGALKTLRERNLVEYESHSFIVLTEEGLALAAGILAKHKLLSHFLSALLKIPSERAEREACAMEHAVSRDTVIRIKNLSDFLTGTALNKLAMDQNAWETILTKPLEE